MDDLARPAMTVVEADEVDIQPDQWSRVYLNWLEEISLEAKNASTTTIRIGKAALLKKRLMRRSWWSRRQLERRSQDP